MEIQMRSPAAESIVFFLSATSRNYSENGENTEIINIISTFVLLVRLERETAFDAHYGLHHSPVRTPSITRLDFIPLPAAAAQRFALSLRY